MPHLLADQLEDLLEEQLAEELEEVSEEVLEEVLDLNTQKRHFLHFYKKISKKRESFIYHLNSIFRIFDHKFIGVALLLINI